MSYPPPPFIPVDLGCLKLVSLSGDFDFLLLVKKINKRKKPTNNDKKTVKQQPANNK